LEASPLTVETRLSLARRLAPTGTSTARSARTWAWAVRVRGCVEDVVRAVLRRVPAAVRLLRVPERALLLRVERVPVLAGLRLVVVRLVVLGFAVPGVLVDMVCAGSRF
jgi:hypothetical protein